MKAYPEYKASGIDWLGDIPRHWKVAPIKTLLSKSSAGVWGDEAKEDGTDIVCFRVADFDYPRLVLKYNNITFRNVTPSQVKGREVEYGDIVIEKSGGGDLNPVGRAVMSTYKEKATCSNFMHVISANHRATNPFLNYLLATIYGKGLNRLYFAQTTGIQNLNIRGYLAQRVALPPVAEQEAIVAYLDEVTGKVDALIAEKRQQVDDLRAYRTSLITETVTRGLNPDAPLRPSGIDWLGDIPQHWETSKLKYIGEARNGLTYSPDDICEQGKGVLVLRSSNIQNEQLCLEDNVYVSKKVDELMMNEGDILICSRNGSASLVGKCAIIPKGVNASFGAFMMRYRSIINKRYTLYLVRTTLAQHKAQFATSTINQLTNAMIGNMQVAVPPLAEQQAIADFLDAKTAKIDELISELTKQIDELTEYKQAVITEAVTGKVDVRDYKPSN